MLPLLIRVDNLEANTSVQYAYAKSPVRLGRNPMNDIQLDLGFVSQWHAIVRFDANTTEYIDLGSTNGTLANGRRIDRHVPISVSGNVELRIGPLRLFCWRGPAPDHLIQGARRSGFAGKNEAEPKTVALGAGSPDAVSVGQVHAAIGRLKPYYDAYRQAWAGLQQAIHQVISPMAEPMRVLALFLLERQYPELGNEETFRTLAEGQGAALSGRVPTAMASATLIEQFSQMVVPGMPAPRNRQEVERVLERSSLLLEIFAKAFVELMKGTGQFGSEMAVRTVSQPTALHGAKDGPEVLKYLLDWTVDAEGRSDELSSAFVDIMVHQVALLNGLMEGVRSLVQRLGPDEIARDVARTRTVPTWLWPFRAGALWRRFVERHRELTEEDREISAAVFGREFARAYTSVAGERFDDNARLLAGGRG